MHDWQALRGKTVAVVGAGASALDMAINALKANEGQGGEVKMHWLLRQPKHFGGFDYADLFLLTIFQVREFWVCGSVCDCVEGVEMYICRIGVDVRSETISPFSCQTLQYPPPPNSSSLARTPTASSTS